MSGVSSLFSRSRSRCPPPSLPYFPDAVFLAGTPRYLTSRSLSVAVCTATINLQAQRIATGPCESRKIAIAHTAAATARGNVPPISRRWWTSYDLRTVKEILKTTGNDRDTRWVVDRSATRERAKLRKRNWITVHCENGKFAGTVRFIERLLMDTCRMAVILRITKKIVDGPRSIARGRRFMLVFIDADYL